MYLAKKPSIRRMPQKINERIFIIITIKYFLETSSHYNNIRKINNNTHQKEKEKYPYF